MGRRRGHAPSQGERVEQCLLRCARWSTRGRHRQVLAAVQELLDELEQPRLRARLLLFKAQALLALTRVEPALEAASESAELEESPHACHLMANALNACGETERGEELLTMGWNLFPRAIHLPLQLAAMLTDQGRVPEALDTLEQVGLPPELDEEIVEYYFHLRASLLATLARWSPAEQTLREGLDRIPDSALLRENQEALTAAWQRARTEDALVASWRAGLGPLEAVAAEVDEAINRCGAVAELPALQVLAARRLWRAYYEEEIARPQAPDPWGVALVVAVAELDGERPSAAAMARRAGVSATTVRSVLRRLRAFLGELEPQLARRAFGASCNPRLDPTPELGRSAAPQGLVVPFPGQPSESKQPQEEGQP